MSLTAKFCVKLATFNIELYATYMHTDLTVIFQTNLEQWVTFLIVGLRGELNSVKIFVLRMHFLTAATETHHP